MVRDWSLLDALDPPIPANLAEELAAAPLKSIPRVAPPPKTVPVEPHTTARALVVSGERLTGPDAVKRTLRLDLSLPAVPSDWSWSPGDAIGIFQPNDATDVAQLVNLLKDRGAEETADAFQVLSRRNLRLSPLKKPLLRWLAETAQAPEDRDALLYLVSSAGAAQLAALAALRPTVTELLSSFPSCAPSPGNLAARLQPLQPRYYSICSMRRLGASGHELEAGTPQVSIVFNVVDYELPPGRRVFGHCTAWLDKMCGNVGERPKTWSGAEAPQIDIFLRHTHLSTPLPRFLAALAPETPVVLLGPGTGVAPFVGLVGERSALAGLGVPIGPTWLFYGCRSAHNPATCDWLFAGAMRENAALESPVQIAVSVSRETAPASLVSSNSLQLYHGEYVQQSLLRHAKELLPLLLDGGAHVCICGDAAVFGRSAMQAVQDLLALARPGDPEGGRDLFRTLSLESRVHLELW